MEGLKIGFLKVLVKVIFLLAEPVDWLLDWAQRLELRIYRDEYLDDVERRSQIK